MASSMGPVPLAGLPTRNPPLEREQSKLVSSNLKQSWDLEVNTDTRHLLQDDELSFQTFSVQTPVPTQ